jgi:transposase
MHGYSVDVRERVVAARLSGEPTAVVAQRFGVATRTVERYVRQQRTIGDLTPRPHPGRPRRLTADHEAHLLTQLHRCPNHTLTEHCATLERTTGVRLSIATMGRAIARLGWTRKKGRWQPASRTMLLGLPGGVPS